MRAKRLTRLVLLLSLVVGATLVSANGVAHAQKRVVRDPRGENTLEQLGAPDRVWRYADVSKVAIQHRKKVIVVRIDFHSLRKWDQYGVPRGVPFTHLSVLIKAPPTPEYFWMELIREPGYRDARVITYPGGGQLQRTCGVKHTIDYRRDFIRLEAPRRCFKHPRRVKAALSLSGDWAAEGFYASFREITRETRWAERG